MCLSNVSFFELCFFVQLHFSHISFKLSLSFAYLFFCVVWKTGKIESDHVFYGEAVKRREWRV